MCKNIFSAFALACLCLLGSQQASANYDDCLNWSTVAANTGHTSVVCDEIDYAGSGTNCTTTSLNCSSVWMTGGGTGCGTTGQAIGLTATHKKCCEAKSCALPQPPEQIQSPNQDDSLSDVFDGGQRTSAFYGYIDSVLRSPNAGRTLIRDAKLDACIGFTNLNTLISAYSSDPYGGWTACTGSSYCGSSTKNAYCSANSNQVCVDRCNCKYQSALVGLGYADPGCTNL